MVRGPSGEEVGCLLQALEVGMGQAAASSTPAWRSLRLGRVIPGIRQASRFLVPPPSLSLWQRTETPGRKGRPARGRRDFKPLRTSVGFIMKWASGRSALFGKPLLEDLLKPG